MPARIYKPAKTAMQSGTANVQRWVLEFAPEEARFKDPLMGWTGSGDMNSQVRLRFDTEKAAIAYAEKHGIPYTLAEPKRRKRNIRPGGYGDNFAYKRREAWSH